MLSLKLTDGRVSLFCDKVALMNNITVFANRHDYGMIKLTPVSEENGTVHFTLPDSKAPIDADLGLKEGEITLLTFRAALSHVHYRAPYCFEGTDSFVIRFDSMAADGIMANYENNDWWTRPAFPATTGELPDRTVSALLRVGERFVHCYPLCDDVFDTRLKGEGETAALIGSIRCFGYDKVDGAVMAIGEGSDPYQLVHDTMAVGLSGVKQPIPLKEGRHDIPALSLLGWCTYDAFYREVTHDKILQKLDEFKEKGIPIKMLLIDSGWFIHDGDGTKGQRSVDLRANPEKFPRGLKGLIEDVKRDYGIEKVGIWHGFPTIWNGIAKGSYAYEQTKDWLVELNSGFCFPGYTKEKSFGFFNYWHSYLKGEGIDFIKVDIQGMAKLVAENVMDINDAMKNFHAGFEESAQLHFNADVINCMGINQVNVQSRPLTGVSRNSDDFYPRKENGFGEHFLQNGYNAVYHGQIYYCDFDMWWTDHESAHENAVLRAVSGGPVYVSDPLGTTRDEELRRFSDSEGRLYRCDGNGTVCRDNLFADPTRSGTLAKMYNTAGKAGLVAAFNIYAEDQPITGAVKAADVEGLNGDRFLYRLYETKQYGVVRKDESVPVTLARHEAELAVFAPIVNGRALLGLVEKYVSPAAILEESENGAVLRRGGKFAFYSEKAPNLTANGAPVNVCEVAPHIYEADVPDNGTDPVNVIFC